MTKAVGTWPSMTILIRYGSVPASYCSVSTGAASSGNISVHARCRRSAGHSPSSARRSPAARGAKRLEPRGGTV